MRRIDQQAGFASRQADAVGSLDIGLDTILVPRGRTDKAMKSFSRCALYLSGKYCEERGIPAKGPKLSESLFGSHQSGGWSQTFRVESNPMNLIRRMGRQAGFASRRADYVGSAVVELIFPPRCALCREWLEGQRSCLCAVCREGLRVEFEEEACPMCAATVAPYEVRDGRCGKCRGRRPSIGGTVRVGPYAENLGRLIRNYKYGGRDQLGALLGGWLTQSVANAPWLKRVEAIVSVPTHWRRRLRRPLHAADALALVVARKQSLPHMPILRRVRAGPHQVGLSYEQRAKNVRGAFALRRGVSLRDARLLLIDDVKTTGATLAECAKILRRAGAAEIYAAVVVTVGWGRPADRRS